jgi:hypothetical protein
MVNRLSSRAICAAEPRGFGGKLIADETTSSDADQLFLQPAAKKIRASESPLARAKARAFCTP